VSSSDGTNFAIHFSPQTGDGTVGNDRNAVYGSTLVMNENDDITTRLEGFAPFSDVYVWLFSPPVLLGQFVADQNGTLDAAIAQLPDDVGGCPHTLHVAGRLSDGRAIGASLGIWVVPDPFPFADVAALSVHGPSVSCLEDLGAVHGFDDARFRETVAITRRQARNIVASLYGVDTAVRVMPAGTKGPLTRGEVATIVTQLITVEAALATFTDVAASVHADAIGALEAKGLLTGVTAGRFHPDKPVTRGQFASVIVRAYHDQQLAAQ